MVQFNDLSEELTPLSDGRWYHVGAPAEVRVAAGAPGYGSLVWPDVPCLAAYDQLIDCPFAAGTAIQIGAGDLATNLVVLDPSAAIFGDGCESGDTSRWSTAVPP